ncbi:MAG TPA: glycosyltransferase [Methanofastidiosum sp.]|nr:glycosyltransferase [Methanofastidiosum sp.]
MEKRKKIYLPIPKWYGGGPSHFYENLIPFLEKEYEITHDIYDTHIDLGIITALTESYKNVSVLRKNNPHIILIHRLDGFPKDEESLKSLMNINRLCNGTIFQSNFDRINYSILNNKDYRVISNGSDFHKMEGDVLKILFTNYTARPEKNIEAFIKLANDSLYREDIIFFAIGNLLTFDELREKELPPNYVTKTGKFFEVNKEKLKDSSNIIYLGYVDKDNLLRLLNTVDYLYFPSKNDSCPNTVIEAIRCGVPIIYDNSGGTPELVKNFGICLNNFDNNIDLIEDLIKNKNSYKKKAYNNKDLFSIEKAADAYIRYFTELSGVNTMNYKNLKIGWILSAGIDSGSSRMGGFNLHEALLEYSIRSEIIHYNNQFSMDLPITDEMLEEIKDKINFLDIVFFQKVCVGKALDLARYCKEKGKKVIFSIGDVIETPMFEIADLVLTGSPYFSNFINSRYENCKYFYMPDTVEYTLKGNHKTHRKTSRNLTLGWFGNKEKLSQLDFIYDLLEPNDNIITISNTKRATIEMGAGTNKPWDISKVAETFLNDVDLAILPTDTNDERNLFKSSNRLSFLFYLGMPTIVTMIPSYKELNPVDSVNCYIADYNDKEKWKESIEAFRSKNYAERNQMSIRIYHTNKDLFSVKKIIPKYIDIFKYVVEGN